MQKSVLCEEKKKEGKGVSQSEGTKEAGGEGDRRFPQDRNKKRSACLA